MIVKELIEQLSKVDPNKEVFVSYYDEDGEDIVKIDNDRNAVFLVYGDSNNDYDYAVKEMTPRELFEALEPIVKIYGYQEVSNTIDSMWEMYEEEL